jgi:hypothetical protein
MAKTKVKVAVQSKVEEKETEAVLENPLFAYAGRARKIAFAIDVSGSMLVASSFGGTRMEVVKEHLAAALQSMEGNPGAGFGLVTFDQAHHTPLGESLWEADPANVSKGLSAVEAITTVSRAPPHLFPNARACCGATRALISLINVLAAQRQRERWRGGGARGVHRNGARCDLLPR